tara:strand:+ start:55691 stop:56044 length:354 start_codon:yes stop_codon:yes gene_type:complete
MKDGVYEVWRAGDRLLSSCQYKSSLWFRLKGLLGRKTLHAHEGILIKPCQSIHMFFMRFAIDAVFLNKKNEIVRIYPGIRPWRMTRHVWGSDCVLELPAGSSERWGLNVSDCLTFKQ